MLAVSLHDYFSVPVTSMLYWRVDAFDYFRDEMTLDISRLSVRRKPIQLTGNSR